jgi:DNA-binding MarR family transcriptional regulator
MNYPMTNEIVPADAEKVSLRGHAVGANMSVEAFANVVALMSRFLTRLANLEAFKQADVGLAEWLALMAIRTAEGTNNKQLANALGISGQRAAQIGEALKSAGLITAVQSLKDSRKNVMATTELGRASLEKLNEALLHLIADRLKGKSRMLAMARRDMRALMQIVVQAADAPDKKVTRQQKIEARDRASRVSQ